MLLDLGNHSAFSVLHLCLKPKVNQFYPNPTLARPSRRRGQVRFNRPIQDLVLSEPDKVCNPLTFAIPVQRGHGKRRVVSEPEKGESRVITLDDGFKKIQDAINRVSVSRPGLRPKAVPVASDGKQGMEAGRAEMTIEDHLLLISVRRVFR